MAKASPIQTNFTAGELSPRLEGRTDIAKYDNGVKTLENFVIHPQGGATRRPGTQFINEVADSSKAHRLIPFEFNVDQSYAVELGDQTARFYTDGGILVESEEVEYNSGSYPDLGYPLNTDKRYNYWSFFSDDGLKLYTCRSYEYNDDSSSHSLEYSIKQYALSVAYDPTTYTYETEKTFTFADKYSSNVSQDQRILHSGCFFSGRDGNHDTSKTFYVWDGIPTTDITTTATSGTFTNVQIYAFHLTTSYDLSTITSGSIASNADATYTLGGEASGGGSIQPKACSGLAFNVTNYNDNLFYSYYDSGDAAYYNRIETDSSNNWAGCYLWAQSSHLNDDVSAYLVGTGSAGVSAYKLDYALPAAGGKSRAYWPLSTDNNLQVDFLPSTLYNDWYVSNVQWRSTNGRYFYTPDGKPIYDKGTYNGLADYGLSTATASYPGFDDDFFFYDDATYGIGSTMTNGIDGTNTGAPDVVNSSYNSSWLNQFVECVYVTLHKKTNPKDTRIAVFGVDFNPASPNTTYGYQIWTNFYGGNVNTDNDSIQSDSFSHLLCDFSFADNDSSWGYFLTPSNVFEKGALKPFVTYWGELWYSSNRTSDGNEVNIITKRDEAYPYIFLTYDHEATALQTTELTGDRINTGEAFDNFRNDGTPVSITTPFSSSELAAIRYAQSADVLYLSHPDYPPQELIRRGASVWTCEDMSLKKGPLLDPGSDGATVTASARSGVVTITATENIFSATDASDATVSIPNVGNGRIIKLHHGYANIKTFVSPTEVTATVLTNDLGVAELAPTYTASTIAFYEGDPSSTGLEHNDRITDSAGQFIKQGFEAGMFITIAGSIAANNQSGALIVEVTADTMLMAPSVDLNNAAAGSSITLSTDLTADDQYQLGAFSETTGYPSVVSLYEQRLVFANTLFQPQTLFFSEIGDFNSYKPGIDATDAMTYTLASNQVNVIQYLIASRLLICGTSGGEFAVSSGGAGEPLTPTTIQIRRQSNYGSSEANPIAVGASVLFVQRAERKMRELTYNFNTDSYYAPDLTILAEHITKGLIKEVAFQQEPDSVVWCRLNDGSVVGMTYRREEEVVGWHKHTIGGNGFVESLITLPSDTGEAEVYMIVKRTINSATKRYVERIGSFDFGAIEDAKFVDSFLTYSGASVSTLGGLSHLEGETVTVFADGSIHADKTVSSGAITLDRSVTKAVVGYSYDSTILTNRIDSGGTEGTSQAKTKRIREIAVRFLETVGASVGPSTDNLKTIKFGDSGLVAGTVTPLFTGDKVIEFHGDYELDGRIAIKQSNPLPMTVLAIMPLVQTFDR